MHFGFVCPPLRGHLNPTLALAATLMKRGCKSTLFGPPDTEAVVRESGVHFHCVGRETHPPGDGQRRGQVLSRAASLTGLMQVISYMARDTDMFARELPAAFEALAIDAVVTDQLEPAGALVAMKMGLPYVSVANALPINRDPVVPPFFTGWQPAASKWMRQSIKGAEDIYDLMMFQHARVISHYAKSWELGKISKCADLLSPAADFAPITEAFDFPREAKPPRFHYVGPIRSETAKVGEEPPPADDDLNTYLSGSGPLVFASFGTLFGSRLDLFARIAKACRTSGARLVIAHGGRLHRRQIEDLERYGIVRSYVDQRSILRRADLCITHGGMNTTMDSLEFGVPALAIPMAFDQKAIAARVEWHGCGLQILPGKATVSRLTTAISEIFSTSSYRESAAKISASIASSGGASKAADIVINAVHADRRIPAADYAS